MNKKDYIIRREDETEYREVENLVRDSFWNVYMPGCLEHFVLHELRNDPHFIPELDLVMERNGEIIGQIIGVEASIKCDDGTFTKVLTFGPLAIRNDLKGNGYGREFMLYVVEMAKEMGYGAILFEGNNSFYSKSGFRLAQEYGIRYPEMGFVPFLNCMELIPGYLDSVTGEYLTPEGYFVDKDKAEEFDRTFPPKEKIRTDSQIF